MPRDLLNMPLNCPKCGLGPLCGCPINLNMPFDEFDLCHLYEGTIKSGVENDFVEAFYELIGEAREANFGGLYYPGELKSVLMNPRGIKINFDYEPGSMMLRVILRATSVGTQHFTSICVEQSRSKEKARQHLQKMLWALSRRMLEHYYNG